MMNKGKRLNEIIHSVKISEELTKLPWLRPVYDDPEFLIRIQQFLYPLKVCYYSFFLPITNL